MILTLCIIGSLVIGAVIGWRTRGVKDEFDRDLDRIFYEALKDCDF